MKADGSLVARSVNQSRWEIAHGQKTAKKCHRDEGACLDNAYNDFLRDQSILVDINHYKTMLTPFFKQINESRR
jgi:hypothetical protein